MASARRWPSRPIDHCAIYTAPGRVSAIVVGCVGSNSIGSIVIQLVVYSLQEIEPMEFEPCTSAVDPSPPGAVNTSLPAVAVYIALADRRCAVAKFSKSSVCDKVPKIP